jgi:hypothetical protein
VPAGVVGGDAEQHQDARILRRLLKGNRQRLFRQLRPAGAEIGLGQPFERGQAVRLALQRGIERDDGLVGIAHVAQGFAGGDERHRQSSRLSDNPGEYREFRRTLAANR